MNVIESFDIVVLALAHNTASAKGTFPLRGGGYPPIPLRKKSAIKQLFLAKKRLF